MGKFSPQFGRVLEGISDRRLEEGYLHDNETVSLTELL